MAGRRSTAPGPLLTAWGREATADLLTHALLPPHTALPVPAIGAPAWRHVDAVTLQSLRTSAEADLGSPWPAPAPTVVHYLIAGTVGMPVPGRVVVRPLDGARTAELTRDPRLAKASVTARTLDDPLLTAVWGQRLTRLELRVPDQARGSFTITLGVAA